MILYHYTHISPDVIREHGLVPGTDSWKDYKDWRLSESLMGKPVVWLTTEEQLIFRFNPLPTHRVEVKIPSLDGKLKSFEKILKKVGVEADKIQGFEKASSFYIYSGTIPPTRIVSFTKIHYKTDNLTDEGKKKWDDITSA